ncbi:MAG: FHA domain-containing protein [Anaerolineae bacterium]|nr:FHA domain-containing protein [Anaerolineae bacterium]
MIECPSCGKKHRPGTLFCTDCGIYLPTGGTLRTTPLPTDELPQSPSAPREALSDEASAQQPARHAIHIEVLDTGRQVNLPIVSELLLGREDAAHGIFPDIDMTPDKGLERGVSRRHAKIFRQGTEFYIEDVGSANGTFLNDNHLTPYLPYPIKEGDRIQVGQLQLKISLE